MEPLIGVHSNSTFFNGSLSLSEALSPDLLTGYDGIGPVIAAFLSLVGCVFIIVMYVRMRPSFSIFTLVFHLSIANAISSISQIATYIFLMTMSHERVIKFEGILVGAINSSLAICWLWSAFIALYHLSPHSIRLVRLIILAWLVGILSALPAICHALSHFNLFVWNSSVCTTTSSDVVLLGVGSICYVFSLIAYIYLLCRQRNKIPTRISRMLDTTQPVGREERENSTRLKKKKVLAYNLIFIACFSARLVTFIVYESGLSTATVRMLFLALSNLFGLLNAIVYGSSVEVRRHIQLWCGRGRGSNDSMESLVPLTHETDGDE